MTEQNTWDALRESEVARRADVSISLLRKMRREGRGPRFIKFGRIVRYLTRDVEQWMEQHRSDVGSK